MRKRAGSRSYKQAKEVRRAFVRENLGLFTAVTVAYVVVWVIVLWIESNLLPSEVNWFVAGGAVVGYGWGMWMILEEDGSRRLRRAAESEESTSAAFRKLRPHGWYVIDRIEFKGMDVDHVAVGPGGVLAVETKHTMVPWKLTANTLQGPYRDPVQQAQFNARKIGHLLKSEDVEVPVVPAVVVWGRGAPSIPGGVKVLDGVAILAGTQVDEWRPELLQHHLDVGTVEAVREVLQRYVERRDSSSRR